MRFTSLLLLSLFSLLLVGAGCSSASLKDVKTSPPVVPPTSVIPSEHDAMTSTFSGILPADRIEKKLAHIVTAKGDIVFELYPETAPLAVSNFVALAEREFYNGLTFHRRVEEFVIQGGDPSGNGTGGPGYAFPDELKDSYTYERGIVAMANSGPNTNGSQFFIMLKDEDRLPKSYTIFGRVLSGIEVVDQIRVGDVMTRVTIEDRPSF